MPLSQSATHSASAFKPTATGKKSVSAYQFKEYITTVPEDILKELTKYKSDIHTNVRQLVYDLYYQGIHPKTNKKTITITIKSLQDKKDK